MDDQGSIQEAIRLAIALEKSPASAVRQQEACFVIPTLAEILPEDDELRALAERWMEDPASLGRRARDLAAELARRVAAQLGLDLDD